MAEQITLEEALELVEFKQAADGSWFVRNVFGCVCGDVYGVVDGDVYGYVGGNVKGNVGGNVKGNVKGNVLGTISGKKWQFIETPKEKLKRLIEDGADKEQLLKAFNQMEDSND